MQMWEQTRVVQLRKKEARLDLCRRSCELTDGEGPPLPLGSVRGEPPSGTCRDIHGATFARFGRAILEPVHLLATSAVSKAPV